MESQKKNAVNRVQPAANTTPNGSKVPPSIAREEGPWPRESALNRLKEVAANGENPIAKGAEEIGRVIFGVATGNPSEAAEKLTAVFNGMLHILGVMEESIRPNYRAPIKDGVPILMAATEECRDFLKEWVLSKAVQATYPQRELGAPIVTAKRISKRKGSSTDMESTPLKVSKLSTDADGFRRVGGDGKQRPEKQ